MIGYVMDNETANALVSVLAEITLKAVAVKLRNPDGILSPSRLLDHETSADTFHERDNGTLGLHHLLVGVMA